MGRRTVGRSDAVQRYTQRRGSSVSSAQRLVPPTRAFDRTPCNVCGDESCRGCGDGQPSYPTSAQDSPLTAPPTTTPTDELGAKSATEEYRGTRKGMARNQASLPEVVASKAFECIVDSSGVLSKVVNVVVKGKAEHKKKRGRNTGLTSKDGRSEASGFHRRHSRIGRSSSLDRLEPLQYGASMDVGSQVGRRKKFRPSPGLTCRSSHKGMFQCPLRFKQGQQKDNH